MRLCVWIRLLPVLLLCALPLLVGVSTVYGRLPVWQGTVYSSGVEVTGPVLASGTSYSIVAKYTWWYKYLPDNLAADAMYYTTDPSNNIFWGNHFPAPFGHSFLQIDLQDVDWGPFSNGDTDHTYTTVWNGDGTAVSFRIVDWMDGNYTNNVCHINLEIYACPRPYVGGYITDTNHLKPVLLLSITCFMLAMLMATAFIKHPRRKMLC